MTTGARATRSEGPVAAKAGAATVVGYNSEMIGRACSQSGDVRTNVLRRGSVEVLPGGN